MSDAKKKVEALINKKKKRLLEHRARRFKGPKSIIHEFINAMDSVLESSTSQEMFSMSIQSEINTFNNRMKQLDPDIDLKIQWTKGDDWKEMRVEGVEITWSSFYLGKHPFNEKVTYIDIGNLFLEGMFD